MFEEDYYELDRDSGKNSVGAQMIGIAIAVVAVVVPIALFIMFVSWAAHQS